jgi:chemotaxis protein MotC
MTVFAFSSPGRARRRLNRLGAMLALASLVGGVVPVTATSPGHSDAPAKAVVLPSAPPLAIEPVPLVDMVRALKVTQGRLAHGDEGALKASHEQVNTILAWLETAPAKTWQDRRNIQALAVFLLGGGSFGGRALLAESKVDVKERDLINAVLAYADGRFDEADGLKSVDALRLEPILGAHIALAQATLLTATEPQKAYELLAQSALLAPGTLIEEAALRRQILMAAEKRETGNLARVIEVYVRRFPRSVYRRGLVDAIVSALGRRVFESKDEIIGVTIATETLTHEERSRIGLMLAESQIAEGRLEWAGQIAEQTIAVTAVGSREHVRAQLYRAVSGVAHGHSREAAAAFDAIDPHQLSASDETLLKAAQDVVAGLAAAAESVPPGAAPADAAPPIVSKARLLVAEADRLLGGNQGQ